MAADREAIEAGMEQDAKDLEEIIRTNPASKSLILGKDMNPRREAARQGNKALRDEVLAKLLGAGGPRIASKEATVTGASDSVPTKAPEKAPTSPAPATQEKSQGWLKYAMLAGIGFVALKLLKVL